MRIEYYKTYSEVLGKDMEFKVFGDRGKACLVFPAEEGRFYDFENYGMIEASKKYIEEGKIQFYCVDALYDETWLKEHKDPRACMELHEKWYTYIIEELVPLIQEMNQKDNEGKDTGGIMTTGCSIGGFQALNIFLRRPDIFDKVLSLSGMFHSEYYLGDYHDELTYSNSPLTYLPNMGNDHYYIGLYNQADIILCCGQGYRELDYVHDHNAIEHLFQEKGIDAWVAYWGYDVSHDWEWWRKQLDYFLQFMGM